MRVEVIARRVLKRTARRVRQRGDAGVLPPPVRGRMPLIATTAAYVAYLETMSGGPQLGPDEREARRRKILAEAQLAELELAERSGAVAPIATSVRVLEEMVVVSREHLLAVPGKLAALLSPEDVEIVRDALHEALDDLAGPVADRLMARVGQVEADEEAEA